MIYDSIENARLYFGLGERIKTAFEFIKTNDCSLLKEGKIEIDGNNIFALVQKYDTKDPEEAKFEAHQKYIDIQYMVAGTENIGFVLADYLDVVEDYNEEKDVELLDGDGDFVQISEGEFVMFFPDDAHKPGIKVEENEPVHKMVIKVKI
ncbi:MAG: YhcH/YjgK/YiaL family protein [Melioribacteraceae bacterium]|nr:YhcH/YjgK/YiaL family protein [Melioribacteraceae bacterium]